MLRSIANTCLILALLSGCTNTPDSSVLSPEQIRGQSRVGISWWQQFNDQALNKDISTALSTNPDLAAIALRIRQADASVLAARAATQPRLNLGFEYREGQKREANFGPYTLAPWKSSAGLSWELDLSGKLRAASASARENKAAAIWDFHAAHLLLASRLASVRLNLYRLNRELSFFQESIKASNGSLKALTERSKAGLISDSVLEKQRAEHEQLVRGQLDLTRLRDLTIVQLRSLRGGSNPGNTMRSNFPSPKNLATKPIDELLSSHPKILAAEARVRSAFQIEQAARLDLLPSFKISALASGAQKNLANRFSTWITQIGPSLSIPIHDPIRLASLKSRKADAQLASTTYQSTVLKTLEEIDSARINLVNRRAQLAAAERESSSLTHSLAIAREQFEAGLTSQIELLETERRWLKTKRSETSLQQSLLNARLDLIKATGGGRW